MSLPPLQPFQPTEVVDKQQLSTAKRVLVFAKLNSGQKISRIMRDEHLTRLQVMEIQQDQRLAELSDTRIQAKTKEMLGTSFYMASSQFLAEATNPAKVRRLPADRAMVAAAVAFDKGRLADGLSTENVSVRGIVGHLDAKAKEAEEMRSALLKSIAEVD